MDLAAHYSDLRYIASILDIHLIYMGEFVNISRHCWTCPVV